LPDRLSPLDASFLFAEHRTAAMHVGAVMTFAPPADRPFDPDAFTALIGERLSLVPGYRRKLREVPGGLGLPVWVDDPSFDLAYHVRRSALPAPGTPQVLRELVGRLLGRQLDRSRPLWEVYLVEGLAARGSGGGRFAVVAKTHQAMVDGVTALDLAQVVFDRAPDAPPPPAELWMPRPEPGDVRLVLDAVAETVARPGELAGTVRTAAGDALATAARVVGGVGQLLAVAGRRAPGTPLNVAVSTQRRFATTRTSLEAYRAVRAAHGCTVNDVVLAVVAGALRAWLLSRGEPVSSSSSLRALVPLTLRDGEAAPGHARVAPVLVDLPVGEPSPVLRLHHVAHAVRAHTAGRRPVAADALIRVGGFAPPTLHALAARAAGDISKRIFNLVVTNVPGPQFPLYAAGARMLEMFPVVPLAKGQALAIGVTSYDGGLYYGFNGDRDAMHDLGVLAGMVEESLDELTATVA
jgi:diacylglycerol O-acyltransferase